MTWSTRELADLAGTTVNAVRHYHSLGLLEAPERRYNGYKQYRVSHLVRLIQVRRLVELGVPLAHVREDGSDAVVVLGELAQLDTRVREEIERLHQTRSDIAAILRNGAPVHAPRGFEAMASRLSEADQALIHIYARIYDDESMTSLRQMVAAEPHGIRDEFDALRADADESARQQIVHAMITWGTNWRWGDRAGSGDPSAGRGRLVRTARLTVAEALRELYNSAQCDVLNRALACLLEKEPQPAIA